MNKTRLEAFSDGVIAIIITIMVLEMKAPHHADFQSLLEMGPSFISYVLSFIFVGVYWGNHHHLLHTIKTVSTGVILGNLHLLFWLSLVPFATGWMGENHFAPFAVACYAVLLNICGISYTILQNVITRCVDYNSKFKPALKKQTQKGIISMIGYTSAIPLAYINPLISVGLIFIIAVLWLVPDKNIERAVAGSSGE